MRHRLRSSPVRLAAIALGFAAGLWATLASAQTVLSQTNIGGGPRVVAVNPVNDKVYIARHGARNVRVVNEATGAVTDIDALFGAPTTLAVDPVTGRVMVGGEGFLDFIDGSSDALLPNGFGGGTLSAILFDNTGHTAASIAASALNPASQTVYFSDTSHNEVFPFEFAFNGTEVTANSAGPVAVNPASGKAYIANVSGAALQVFSALGSVGNVSLPANPVAIAANPVTNTIYVALAGTSGVAVVDGSTDAVTTTIGAGTDFSSPTAVAVNPVTNKIYVANSGTNDVVVIDGANNSMTHVSVGANPVAISVDGVRSRIYVANEDGISVSVIDGVADTLITTVDIDMGSGGAPSSIAVNPLTSRVYVVDETNGFLTVLDGRTFTGSTTVAVTGATEAAVDPVRARGFLLNADHVAVVASGDDFLETNVDAGGTVSHIAVDPVSGRLFAARADKTVEVIEPDNSLSGTTLTLGGTPVAMASNPATQKVYVATSGLGEVEVINAGTLTLGSPIAIGPMPADIAVDAANNRFYTADGSGANFVFSPGTGLVSLNGSITPASRVVANPASGHAFILHAELVDEFNGNTFPPSLVHNYSIAGGTDIAVNSITNHVYVTDGTTSLHVLDPVSGTELTPITLPDTGSHVAIDELANRIFVSTPTSVVTIDGETGIVVANTLESTPPGKAAIDSAVGEAWVPVPGATHALAIAGSDIRSNGIELFGDTTPVVLPGAGGIVTSLASPVFRAPPPVDNYAPHSPGGLLPRSGADDLYGPNVTGSFDSGLGKYLAGVASPLTTGLHYLTIFSTDNMSGTVTNSQAGTLGANGGLSFLMGSPMFVAFVVVDPPAITTGSPMADGTEGIAYSQSVTASGGTGANVFTITGGALPDGLSIDSASGAITGTPTLAGTYNFMVTVTDDSGGNSSTALAITIVAGTPQILVSPATTFAFGSVFVLQSSTGQVVTVANPGWGTLTISNVSATVGAGDFPVSGNGCTTLTHNQTCSFTITFTPTTTGARAGKISVVSQLGNTDISATGTGLATMHTLTAAANGTGTGTIVASPPSITCPGDCSEPFANGLVVTLTATPAAGSTFSQWAGCDSVTSNQCTITVNNDATVTATFTTLATYNIVLEGYQEAAPYVQATASGGGTAVFDSFTGDLTFNLSYTGLSGNETDTHIYNAPRGGNGVAVIPMSGGTTKTDAIHLGPVQQLELLAGNLYVNIESAAFPNGEIRGQIDNLGAAPIQPLAASIAGDGNGVILGESEAGGIIVCGLLCNANVPSGKPVTFTPLPTSGSIFAGWGGACSGTGTCNVTMDAAKTVTATFNLEAGPTITLASSATHAVVGDTVTFTVSTSGGSGTPAGHVTLQDGNQPLGDMTLDGTGHATFQVSSLAAGTHSLTVKFFGDTDYAAATSAPVTVNVFAAADVPRLANISTRMDVLTGNNVMIAGFIIGGSTPKTVAITATGPSLVPFGITNPLANPTLTLVRQSDHAVIATNDDWQSDVNAAQLTSSGFAPTDPHESGLVVTLPPGAYTAIVSGAGNGIGVSVIGVFEIDHPEIPLINISTRGLVQGGNNVMIAGLIVQGSGPQKVVITATGPSLAPFGITNPLANPTLTLVRQSDHAVIGTNDDWQTNANAADITASGFAPTDPHESALLVTLDPGAYTAIVSGVGGGTGVSVVGVFTVP